MNVLDHIGKNVQTKTATLLKATMYAPTHRVSRHKRREFELRYRKDPPKNLRHTRSGL